MPRIRLCFLVIAMAVSMLAGCATGTGGDAPSASSSLASTAPPGPAVTGPPGPTGQSPAVPDTLAFSAPMVGGGRFDAATLAGKPAVLWFWAAWCPRCRAKADNVRTAQVAHAGKVNFVGVAGLGSGADAMQRFVADHGLGAFPHLADDEGVVWRRFGVTEQEYFVLLDSAGGVVHKGPLSDDELRQRVSSLAG
jgi:peroxiredoxin